MNNTIYPNSLGLVDSLGQEPIQVSICLLKENVRQCMESFKYIVHLNEHQKELYDNTPKSDFEEIDKKVRSEKGFIRSAKRMDFFCELATKDPTSFQEFINNSPKYTPDDFFFIYFKAIKEFDVKQLKKPLGENLKPGRLFKIIPPFGPAPRLNPTRIKEPKNSIYVSPVGDFKSSDMLNCYNNILHSVVFVAFVVLGQLDEACSEVKETNINKLGDEEYILSFAYNVWDLTQAVIKNIHAARGYSHSFIKRSKTNRKSPQKAVNKKAKLVASMISEKGHLKGAAIEISALDLFKIFNHGDISITSDPTKKKYVKLAEEILQKTIQIA